MRKAMLAGLTWLLTGTAALAVPLEGTWTGVYTCAQGATPVELYVQGTPTGRLDGRFHFGDGSPGRPEGCFAMLAAPDPGNLRFSATHWFVRPFGYVSVNLAGSVNGPVYSGAVFGPGCTGFQMVWHPPAPLPYACR